MARHWHLDRYPGLYVAVDLATDEVALSAETPHALEAELGSRGLTDVMCIRAPRKDEPLFVGPG